MNRKWLRYAITDRRLLCGNAEELDLPAEWQSRLALQAAQLAAGGIDLLQLREKDLPAGELAAIARSMLRALRSTPTRLLINGRVDIAVATGAHGVHLTSGLDELTARQVHDLYALTSLPSPIVTLSCHTLEDIVLHRMEPLTAILFGPVFEKSVSGELHRAGTGLALLRRACEVAAPIPVLALGGVTVANSDACMAAGAGGIAGIRLFA